MKVWELRAVLDTMDDDARVLVEVKDDFGGYVEDAEAHDHDGILVIHPA